MEYTPTYRGFDSFAGSFGGHSDVSSIELWLNEEEDLNGEYGLFHERDAALRLLTELGESVDPFFLYISWIGAVNVDDEERRIEVMDESIGDIVDKLKSAGLWDSTLMVFASDHGAGEEAASADVAWEGAVRVPAFVSGGVLPHDRRGKMLQSDCSQCFFVVRFVHLEHVAF